MTKMFAFLCALVLLMSEGCASFKSSFKNTGRTPAPLSMRSDYAHPYGVSVVVWPGDGRPYCAGPDAGDEIRCEFNWTWLQTGSKLTAGGGWLFLTMQDARDACVTASFPLGLLATPTVIQTCAGLLMQTRIMDLPPNPNPENQ